MDRLLRWIRTYRHFRAPQLAGRVLAGLRRALRLTQSPSPPRELAGRISPEVGFIHHDPWNSTEVLRQGRMTFLNQSRSMGRPWDWEPQDMPLLWRFHLHYFAYLHHLDEEERRDLCVHWIAANPMGKGVGWHPYPTSLRIVNWCKAFTSSAPPELLRSLYRQAGYLARNLETYLSGNHLLENARALVFAGVYFGESGEAPDWLDKGLAIYRQELPSQVLPDGGHYERSPMYHAQVLEGCLDVLNVFPPAQGDRSLFRETVQRMLGFLRGTTHPDGCAALFNDAAVDGAPPFRSLLTYARRIGCVASDWDAASSSFDAFPDSGYYRYEKGLFTLLLDAGPIGPDHQPAHGHAGAFSFELSVGDQRVVTDTGVYEYRAGEMRDYCRGTRAHNTVQVDGVDQDEVWGSFRVARRYEPTVEEARIRDGVFHFRGTFRGYADLIGDDIVHRRQVVCNGEEGRLRIEDRVDGRGLHCVASRLHLHPEISVERISEGLRLEREDTSLLLRASDGLTVESGWYCPRFGVRLERPVIRLGSRASLPGEWWYELQIA